MTYAEKFMKAALKEAEKAERKEEVPIGCVIVKDGKIFARAHNLRQTKRLATAHAEILAIEKACRKIKDWRLDGYEIFITLEPCAMCAGAIANARISKVYFGAYEKKGGGAVSKFNILSESGLNHVTEWEGGVLEEECSAVIKNFFSSRRKKSE
ncbi:MAG: nucleoside deaminase [Candidatus Borkfalkiaceae bacterium]|nr:nucleoside deaminase [Christensenellaceae bacterium]MDY3724484.1 nucleoside deaminase [Christensenellaceae bacterium]